MAIVEIPARGSTAWSDRLSSSLPSYLLYNKTVKFSNVWPGLYPLVLKQLLNVFNVSFRILVIILKVDGNEKLGGLRFLQLLGIGLGPWRSMSIFILNMPFANAKRISISALSSKMNR